MDRFAIFSEEAPIILNARSINLSLKVVQKMKCGTQVDEADEEVRAFVVWPLTKKHLHQGVYE